MMTELTAMAGEAKVELTENQLRRVGGGRSSKGGGSSKGASLPTETVTFIYGAIAYS